MKYIVFHIVLLLKMLPVLAQNPNKLLYEGNEEYKNKNYTEAEKKYREAKLKNSSIESYFNLGDALYAQGKYDSAGSEFNKSISMAKNQETIAAAYHNLGNSLLKNNKIDESIEAYKQALRYKPGDKNSQYNLTYALRKKQEQEKEKKEEKEEKEDPNQEEKKENKDQKGEEKENQPKEGKNQGGMSKEEAERILNGLKNKEQNLRKQIYKNGKENGQPLEEKPW